VSLHPFRPPAAYRREVALLEQEGQAGWTALAALSQAEIRRIARSSPGSEARLLRLRGQAKLLVALDLAPAEAALLLHAGVPDPAALASSDAHTLHRRIGRLQRGLAGSAMAPLPLATVRAWVLRAASLGAGRSGN